MRLLVIIQTFSLAFNKLVLFCGNRVYVQKLWLNSFVALFKTINLCLVVRVVYCHSCFSLKASLKKSHFGMSYFFSYWQTFRSPWRQRGFLLISGACGYTPDSEHAVFSILEILCVQRWRKVKYVAPPDFVEVWIYVQTEELKFYSCDWVLLCIWPMNVFEMDLILRQAETETLQVRLPSRPCLRWRGSNVLLERSPTCFLPKKPSLFKLWAWLSYFHIYFFRNLNVWK